MSFYMACSPDDPTYLLLSYWGGETSKRNFEIFVESQKIGDQELLMNKPDELFDVLYTISPQLTKGKKQVKITLKSASGSIAGGLFYAYTFSRKKE